MFHDELVLGICQCCETVSWVQHSRKDIARCSCGAQLAVIRSNVFPAEEEPVPAREIRLGGNRLRLVRCIGEGGFGRVYLARSIQDGKYVAIKFPRNIEQVKVQGMRLSKFDRQSLKDMNHLLRKEFEILDRYRHTGFLVDILDAGELTFYGHDINFIVMELGYVTLRSLLEQIELPPALRLEICAALLYGFVAVHSEGLSLGDIATENIMLFPSGFNASTALRVKAIDMGAALSLSRKRSGPTAAHHRYMGWQTNELARDTFALGVLLFEVLANVGDWTQLYSESGDMYASDVRMLLMNFERVIEEHKDRFPEIVCKSKFWKSWQTLVRAKNGQTYPTAVAFFEDVQQTIDSWPRGVISVDFLRRVTQEATVETDDQNSREELVLAFRLKDVNHDETMRVYALDNVIRKAKDQGAARVELLNPVCLELQGEGASWVDSEWLAAARKAGFVSFSDRTRVFFNPSWLQEFTKLIEVDARLEFPLSVSVTE